MLVYDPGARRWAAFVSWVEPRLPLGVPVVPSEVDRDQPLWGLTRSDLRGALWWIGTDGVPRRGLRAVAGCLAATRWAARR